MEPLLVRTLRRQPVERLPVWMMRQAGRYLPRYRDLRARGSFLDLCRDPEAAAEVSLEPYERFGVDGVIVFSDILPVLSAMGLEVDYPSEGGPRLANRLRTADDVARLQPFDSEVLAPTYAAIRLLLRRVDQARAVIGFSAAPFTLALYAIEGGGGRDFDAARRFLYLHPEAFERLLGRLAEALGLHLRRQAAAGAQVLQVFDTFGGVLDRRLHQRYVLEPMRTLLRHLGSQRPPVIYFPGLGSTALLDQAAALDLEALSVDWRVDLGNAWQALGHRVALQGNLDPALLCTDPETVGAATRAMLAQVPRGAPHVANLGHGIHPQTPPECAAAFVQTVQRSAGCVRT